MGLNITNIKIENVKQGTVNQVAKGIHGKFSLDLFLDSGVCFASLRNMTLRKTKAGVWYIQPPYETWGEDNKKSFFYFFYPNSDDRDAKMQDLLNKVVEMVNSAGDQQTAPSTAPATSASDGMGDNLF